MKWFASWLLVMGLLYSAATAIWESIWIVVAGGVAFAVLGALATSTKRGTIRR